MKSHKKFQDKHLNVGGLKNCMGMWSVMSSTVAEGTHYNPW